MGHLARDCPKKLEEMSPWKCREKGNRERDCKVGEKLKTEQEEEEENKISDWEREKEVVMLGRKGVEEDWDNGVCVD